jgi:hypothetical protein
MDFSLPSEGRGQGFESLRARQTHHHGGRIWAQHSRASLCRSTPNPPKNIDRLHSEVSLIAYLWPLLIVLFATLLPNEQLRSHHLIGTALGLFGAVVIITKGGSFGLAGGIRPGRLVPRRAAPGRRAL